MTELMKISGKSYDNADFENFARKSQGASEQFLNAHQHMKILGKSYEKLMHILRKSYDELTKKFGKSYETRRKFRKLTYENLRKIIGIRKL